MTIGTYDKRVTVQVRTGEADALGNVVSSWVDRAERWAVIADGSGSELYRAQQVDPTVSAVVTLRERFDGLKPTDRIKYGDRVFHISAVTGGSDRTVHRGQVLACIEEVVV